VSASRAERRRGLDETPGMWRYGPMTCPEFIPEENKCGVDGFKFYEGMNKPCETPGMTKEKCPRFAMQK